MFVGVDIGGTFTDLVYTVDGKLHVYKLSSTPEDPSQALLAGLRYFRSQGLPTPARLTHGSTVATNAILERDGARTALITTHGFKDILAIGRQDRPELYDLHPQLPPPLIPAQHCFGVEERLNHRGEVITPLRKGKLDPIFKTLKQEEIESLAVCFLFSYLNPDHEKQLKNEIISRGILEEDHISLSSEVLPEFREFERASTVALEAYVRPVIGSYLENLEEALAEQTSLLIMNSDGGVMGTERAKTEAIHTILSGPAAGVIGGFHTAQQAGYNQVITLDMGGTSTDVSLCPGERVHRTDSEIDGLPLRVRMIDIETIGAGGGSIARLDQAGGLHVGPESAGADPGPIIYGSGGEKITVTDAHALLRRIEPAFFLGGKMDLHLNPARSAISGLAENLSISETEAALGILEVTNANIERALRRVSISRGYDPRKFTLVAFGGAGPLHACDVAQRLEIPRVLVPFYPGMMCAYGLLMADVVLEESQSILQTLTPHTRQDLNREFRRKEKSTIQQLQREGIERERIMIEKWVDMRYRGQSFELTLPVSNHLIADFHRAHRDQYGHSFPDREVEVVTLRLRGVGFISRPSLESQPVQKNDGGSAWLGKKTLPGSDLHFARYQRDLLEPGATFSGPGLVFQMDSTTYIPPGWNAYVDGYRNLILESKS